MNICMGSKGAPILPLPLERRIPTLGLVCNRMPRFGLLCSCCFSVPALSVFILLLFI
jgi:hypothetical protein